MSKDLEVKFCARFVSGCKNNNLDEIRLAMEEYENCEPAKPLDEIEIEDDHYPGAPHSLSLVNYVVKYFGPEILGIVLEKKAFKITENCMTPLHWLVDRNSCNIECIKKMFKMLCDVGYDINAKNNIGITQLYWAWLSEEEPNLKIVKLFVEAGANVDVTLLEGCASIACHSMFLYLLQNGVDPDLDVDTIIGDILHFSKFPEDGDYMKIFKDLVGYGFDVNKLPEEDIGPLLSSNSELQHEQIKEIHEILHQSGYKFTDSLLETTKWMQPKQEVLSLQRLSANKLRGCLRPNLYQKLKTLDGEWLPKNVIDYILMKHL